MITLADTPYKEVTNMNNKNYDVIIAGCGAAGLYAALNLSRI